MFPVVGVPEPGLVADTVPVKVTEVLTTEGLRLEVTTVVVAAAFTTWVIDVETADAAKLSYVLSTLKQAIEARDARLVALPAPADTRVFPDLQDFYATVNFVDPPATDDDEKPSDVVPS